MNSIIDKIICIKILFFCFFLSLSSSVFACDGMDLVVNSTVDNGDGTWTYYITACIEPDNGSGAPTAIVLGFAGATGIVSYLPSVVNAPGTTWNATETQVNEITWGSGGISTTDAQFCHDFVVIVTANNIVPTVTLGDGNACDNDVTPPQPNCDIVGTPTFTDLLGGSPYDCTSNSSIALTAFDADGIAHFTDGITINIDTDSWSDTENSLVITGSDGTVMEYGPSNTGPNYVGTIPETSFNLTLTNIAPGTVFTLDWCDSANDGGFEYTITYNTTGAKITGEFGHSADFGQDCYQVVTVGAALAGTATFSGDGVTNNGDGTGAFNPSGLSDGPHTITYTYDNGRGCVVTATQDIVVNCATCDPTWSASSICVDAGPLDLTTLVTGDAGGTWSGTGVTGANFDPSGQNGAITLNYDLGTCDESHDITVNAADPSWTTAALCASDGVLDLITLITGDAGGTWSGTGVSGSNFDPSGQNGNIFITYSVTTNSCTDALTQNISVTSNPDATWNTTTICESDGLLDLTTLEAGTNGGTWSGTGVTGSNFDPTGQSGNVSLTYTVGGGSCNDQLSQNIVVDAAVDASWSTTALCADAGILDLNTLVTGTAGGVWSGVGVTGANFDPTGLSGICGVTYDVGAPGCDATSTQNIDVVQNADASWVTTTVCSSDLTLDLNTLITGTTGGNWDHNRASNGLLDLTDLNGLISIKYVVGSGSCADSLIQSVQVDTMPIPITVDTSICETSGELALDLLDKSAIQSTWNGSDVTNAIFDPIGKVGINDITFSITNGVCTDNSTSRITVSAAPLATWLAPTEEVLNESDPIDLNALLSTSSTTGGVWSGTNVENDYFDPLGLKGDYEITYEVGENGCSNSETYTITVVGIYSIHFYNAFSPNGDDTNDGFSPIGDLESAVDYVFRVYNRWGEKVFETTEKDASWNGGRFNVLEHPVVQDTYVYRVELANYKGEKENYTGSVLLLR